MAAVNKVTYDNDLLTQMRANLKEFSRARVKVGLIGNQATRLDPHAHKRHMHDGASLRAPDKNSDAGITNAEVGFIHEFGNRGLKIPARSFLRMPLMTRLKAHIDKVGLDVFRQTLAKNGAIVALIKLGIAAEHVVQLAFSTRGFGQWRPNSWKTIKIKGSSSPLIDTAQMRQAITSQVVKNP